jgi:hypothetical protein
MAMASEDRAGSGYTSRREKGFSSLGWLGMQKTEASEVYLKFAEVKKLRNYKRLIK